MAYRIHTVEVSTRIRVSGNAKVRNAFSPVPVRLFALGNAEAPYEDSVVVADEDMIVSDEQSILGNQRAVAARAPDPRGRGVCLVHTRMVHPSASLAAGVDSSRQGRGACRIRPATLRTPEGTNFYMSGRGVLQTPTLKFTAILQTSPAKCGLDCQQRHAHRGDRGRILATA